MKNERRMLRKGRRALVTTVSILQDHLKKKEH